MPIYIRGGCRIDWGWKDRTAAERKIARAYHHRLDDDDHGLDSFGELLAEASVALPTADIRALVEDETRSRTLFLARAGKVQRIFVKDATRRGPWDELPWHSHDSVTIACGSLVDDVERALAAVATDADEMVVDEDGSIELPVAYRSEAGLRSAMDVVARAMSGEPEQLVAEVDEQRFLVSLRPGAARFERLFPWPESDSELHATLINRLLVTPHRDLLPPPPERNPKVERTFTFPKPQLDVIWREKLRTELRLSDLLLCAWKLARPRLEGLADHAVAAALLPDHAGAPEREMSFEIPATLAGEIDQHAARLGGSASWVVQLAFVLGAPAFAELPSLGE